jgi:hypothetical protein
MKADSWDEILASLKVTGTINPPSEADLAEYETEQKFKLPASYRGYCEVFGPGELGNWYVLATPGYTGKHTNKYNLADKTRFFREGLDWEEYSTDPEQFSRAIIFGSDGSGTIYFWDPTEITATKKREYAIYVMFRNWKVKRVCDTFWQFIQICLQQGDKVLYDDPPDLVFRPAKSTKK